MASGGIAEFCEERNGVAKFRKFRGLSRVCIEVGGDEGKYT